MHAEFMTMIACEAMGVMIVGVPGALHVYNSRINVSSYCTAVSEHVSELRQGRLITCRLELIKLPSTVMQAPGRYLS